MCPTNRDTLKQTMDTKIFPTHNCREEHLLPNVASITTPHPHVCVPWRGEVEPEPDRHPTVAQTIARLHVHAMAWRRRTSSPNAVQQWCVPPRQIEKALLNKAAVLTPFCDSFAAHNQAPQLLKVPRRKWSHGEGWALVQSDIRVKKDCNYSGRRTGGAGMSGDMSYFLRWPMVQSNTRTATGDW